MAGGDSEGLGGPRAGLQPAIKQENAELLVPESGFAGT